MLAWCVAGILGQSDQPVLVLARLLENTEIPSEGWQSEYSRFLESEIRVCHVLTVGSMASEWLLQREKRDAAVLVYDLVWKYFLRWLRGLHDEMHGSHVVIPLVHIWARLPAVHGHETTQIALAGIELLDHIELIILACENLQANLPEPRGLDRSLQQMIHCRFEEEFPAIRRRHGMEPKQLDALLEREQRLTQIKQ